MYKRQAYISGEKIKNEWDGVTHDYTRKEKVLVKNIILPDHIPKEFNDRSTLWNKVEMAEKNSNAQLARQFIIGLPKELSLSENKNLVERFIKENLTSQGMIVDYAIHDESQDKNGNIHCHIMTIMLSLIHISEPTRLGMISYAVFCLKKKKQTCS